MMTRGTQSIGLGSNGKGSKDRTTDKAAYDQNRAEIAFPGVLGGTQTSRVCFRKVYGSPSDKFRKHLTAAAETVAGMPAWKQNILGYVPKSGMRPAGEPPCGCESDQTCGRCRAWPGGSDAQGANVAPGPEPLTSKNYENS